jgi:hypothetical protein
VGIVDDPEVIVESPFMADHGPTRFSLNRPRLLGTPSEII